MEDLEPIRTPPKTDLERLSVDELNQRIAELEAEILACRAELDRKTAHKSAADALFGKGS